MDTTTTKENATEVAEATATKAKEREREKSLSDEIRSMASNISYIEDCVDGVYPLYEGNIENSLEKCFDLKKKAKRDTPEWRMIRRLINRLIACAADARRL